MVATRTRHAVHEYAERAAAGEILVGRWVRLACERHLRDLRDGHARGLTFDETAADRVIRFLELLPHIKGEWARSGGKIRLEPWQKWIVGSLFGWKRADGTRRFRTGYVEVARKCAKSTLAAGLGLWLAFLDGEPGAEVYCAATKRDQAKIVWGDARSMVLKTPELRQRITALVGNLYSEATSSKFQPLGADADSMDGLNIHGAIVDELHAHKTRAIVDVLETATGARRQPLTLYITTAGYDRQSVCWSHRDYATKVLDGVIEDDSLFAAVYSIDDSDDWTDEAVWVKANPNLGVSVYPDDLRRKCERAKQVPAEQNAFKRLHLSQWTEQADRWIDVEAWDACNQPVDAEALVGRQCYAGLDLASTTDIAALVLVFPGDDGIDVLPYFWVPEEAVYRRSERDRVRYDLWQQQGLIEATEGNVIDYDVIHERIRDLGERYDIREIAVDRWNSTQLQTQLQGDGFTMVPFGQGFASMSAPTKELEKRILDRSIRHGGNAVLRWMASNVAVVQDAAGNLKPAKDKSTEKIDGIVALIMALDRVTRHGDGASVYESEGLLVL